MSVIVYPPAAYRPPAPTPRTGQYGGHSLGQTFDDFLGLSPAMGDVVRLVGHGAATYVGLYVGLKETGFISALGWLLGVGHGVASVLDVVSLAQRAAGTHPPGK